jgi:hypothetical protein
MTRYNESPETHIASSVSESFIQGQEQFMANFDNYINTLGAFGATTNEDSEDIPPSIPIRREVGSMDRLRVEDLVSDEPTSETDLLEGRIIHDLTTIADDDDDANNINNLGLINDPFLDDTEIVDEPTSTDDSIDVRHVSAMELEWTDFNDSDSMEDDLAAE